MAMIKGEYKVDTERIRIFYRKGLLRAIKISGAVCLIFISSILLIIEDGRVVKIGKGLRTVTINYSDIGRVIKLSNGIVIVKRGFWPVFNLYFRYSRATDPLTFLKNVIFIPIMIQNYERIKGYFINKEYLLSREDKNQI